jgi:hypothetical protein
VNLKFIWKIFRLLLNLVGPYLIREPPVEIPSWKRVVLYRNVCTIMVHPVTYPAWSVNTIERYTILAFVASRFQSLTHMTLAHSAVCISNPKSHHRGKKTGYRNIHFQFTEINPTLNHTFTQHTPRTKANLKNFEMRHFLCTAMQTDTYALSLYAER